MTVGNLEKAFAQVNKNVAELIKKIGQYGGDITEEHISAMFDLLERNVRNSRQQALVAGQMARLQNGMSMSEIIAEARKAAQPDKSKVTYRGGSASFVVMDEAGEPDEPEALPEKRDYVRIAGQKRRPAPEDDDDVGFVDDD